MALHRQEFYEMYADRGQGRAFLLRYKHDDRAIQCNSEYTVSSCHVHICLPRCLHYITCNLLYLLTPSSVKPSLGSYGSSDFSYVCCAGAVFRSQFHHIGQSGTFSRKGALTLPSSQALSSRQEGIPMMDEFLVVRVSPALSDGRIY